MSRENENNRKLSPAENARKAKFEIQKNILLDKGFVVKDLTIGLVYANIMAFVLAIPIIVCFAIVYILCNIDQFAGFGILLDINVFWRLIVFLIGFFILIIIHEMIHGITWSLFTEKGWKSISFGFITKYMTAYCTCDEPLQKNQYIIGGLMPTIILGIIPAAIAIFNGSVTLFAIGAIMTLAGGGDLTIIMKLIMFKTRGKEVVYMDHPYQAGLVAFVK